MQSNTGNTPDSSTKETMQQFQQNQTPIKKQLSQESSTDSQKNTQPSNNSEEVKAIISSFAQTTITEAPPQNLNQSTIKPFSDLTKQKKPEEEEKQEEKKQQPPYDEEETQTTTMKKKKLQPPVIQKEASSDSDNQNPQQESPKKHPLAY